VRTQHLLDTDPGWDAVICAGAAGALADDISTGDIVVGTETVEHDIKNQFGKPRLPRFGGDEIAIKSLRQAALAHPSFRTHFGPIASGDEDVTDDERKRVLRKWTGALAVAWEGAGGARACHFSRVPFVEIRGATDSADKNAAHDFEVNLPGVMQNVATLIFSWAREVGN
jgi:adenosylhomocysteine nucleosidase